MSHRLPESGSKNSFRTIAFTFNGQRMFGRPDDTLASALMANGVRVIGRSLKYHRPRGLFGYGPEDPGSMVAVRDGHGFEPAIRAGQVRLVEGLDVATVSGWPSPRFDAGAAAQLAAPIINAGFYYKTFMWPNWNWFEGAIKRCTGFGRARDVPDTRQRMHRHDTCDVLIIGSGPAGLAAGRALLGSGLRIVIADDQPRCGGSLRWEEGWVDDRPAHEWVEETVALLAAEGVRVLTSTTVCGAYEGDFFTLVEHLLDESGVACERLWKLRARHVVPATGAVERPLVFQNNDRPGVMLSSAVRRYLRQHRVAAGKAVAVYTNNDSGYLTAVAARNAGLEVPVLVDSRSRSAATHADLARSMDIHCVFEAEVVDTRGYKGLKRISVATRGRTHTVACDTLAVAGGWTPLIHLAAQRGSRPAYDVHSSAFLCPDPPRGWHLAGGAAGASSLDAALRSGHAAARAIAACERPAPLGRTAIDYGIASPMWRAHAGKPSKMWVDLQKDVKVSDIALAVRENYVSVEHLKRYTTLGMGTDQGRTSNVNGLAILATLTGREIADVGTTTYRPPYVPLRMGTIAGRRQSNLYSPRRRMPAHESHAAAGAVFEDFGWERPDWFRENGTSREEAVNTEMEAVRRTVGIFDGSPLGKIEVAGPHARDFLNRFYVSNLETLKPGRVRYSVMLKEDGVIFDDGVVACIDDNLFLVGPTSGNAEAVTAWFELWRQTEWPDLKVAVAPVTSNWATVALAGPNARDLLAKLGADVDISPAGFPHMRFQEGRVAGVPARLARVSFTGELQYEVSVSARYGAELLETAMSAGRELGARRVGMEAWLRLRLEKGYLHLGADTNGRTIPADIGMGALAANKQADFIGKRSLSLPYALDEAREQLVGLRSNSDRPLAVGGRVLRGGAERPPCATDGYVTSACTSAAAGHIAMALIERGFSRMGETVRVYSAGEIVEARICSPVFVDPDNARIRS